MIPLGRLVFACLAYSLVVLFCAEAAARVEDRLRHGVPILHTPNLDRDLLMTVDGGLRGRPFGRYKQWQLNRHGFRSPEIDIPRTPGCTRVMTLGSSETFGLYEASGREYPAQLLERLQATGCAELVNASLYGLTIPRLHHLWVTWAQQFAPDHVVIYPTPAFYLGASAPAAVVLPFPGARPASPPPIRPLERWESRIFDRLIDRVEVPPAIQRIRVRRSLTQAASGRPAEWFFREVPRERVDAFETHLEGLVRSIRDRGAQVVLVTHATGFGDPDSVEDRDALQAWRALLLRPTGQVLLQFEQQARTRVLEIGRRHGVRVVDAAAAMNGHREWFAGDLIHFNEAGAGVMADLIASALQAEHGLTTQ